MSTTFRVLRSTAVAVGLVFLASLAAPAPHARADATDDAVKELKALAKAGEEGKTIAKMVELESNYDARVNKALKDLTKSKYDKIATTAVRRLASRKDKAFKKTLKSKIGDKKLAKKKPDVYIAYLDAAGEYRDPKLLDPLSDVVKKYLPTNPDFSGPAIHSYGTVPDKEVVDQLLKWLGQVDTQGGAGQGGGSGKNLSQETRDNYEKAKIEITKTLLDLTGQDIGDAKTWNDWWDKRRKTFTFPDPDAPEVDVATLKEWTDQAYGYTIKLPEGENWKFIKPEHEPFVRIRMEFREEQQAESCRLDVTLHNISTTPPKSLQGLADWYIKDYTENRYGEFSKGGEPKLEKQTFGGKEWLVASVKGQTSGRFRGWGAAEMRAYLIQIEHIVIRMDMTLRLGEEPSIGEALIATVEKNLTWE